jgi:hypothetical protein
VPFESWRDFYQSDLQAVYSLLVLPALFLAYLGIAGRRRSAQSRLPDAGFVLGYAVVFSIETLLDPLATGLLVEGLELGNTATERLMLLFVLLGDFRVFLLVFHLAGRERSLGRALLWALAFTPIVPILAWTFNEILVALQPELAQQRLYLIYELSFLALALLLRNLYLPHKDPERSGAHTRFLQGALSYVAVYYGLWAAADVLILIGGIDAGWLLRALPNQLYYAFWVPFVFFLFLRRG